MAFSFIPNYKEDFALKGVIEAEYLAAAIKAAEQIGWDVTAVSKTGMIALTQENDKGQYEEVSLSIKNQIVSIRSEVVDNRFFAKGVNTENVSKLKQAVKAAQQQYTGEELARTYEYRTRHQPETHELQKAKADDTIAEYTDLLTFKNGFAFTPLLVIINVLIWIVMVISGVDFWWPDSQHLVLWGANYQPNVLGGEWWRLLTACFVHIGIIHLLLNMNALLIIGSMLEPTIGKVNFIVTYLLTGICASVVSIWWHGDASVSCGASGALFGIEGILLAILTTKLISGEGRKLLRDKVIITILANLMIGLAGPIDNAAHVGGLISGIILGYIIVPGLKKPMLKPVMLGVAAAVALGFTYYSLKAIPDYWGRYHKMVDEFNVNDQRAASIYEENMKDPIHFGTERRDSILILVKRNIHIMNEMDGLKLNTEAYQFNEDLRIYAGNRYRVFALVFEHDSTGDINVGQNERAELDSILKVLANSKH